MVPLHVRQWIVAARKYGVRRGEGGGSEGGAGYADEVG